jgi:hypothetical protein
MHPPSKVDVSSNAAHGSSANQNDRFVRTEGCRTGWVMYFHLYKKSRPKRLTTIASAVISNGADLGHWDRTGWLRREPVLLRVF